MNNLVNPDISKEVDERETDPLTGHNVKRLVEGIRRMKI